jgi:hypothetical protein
MPGPDEVLPSVAHTSRRPAKSTQPRPGRSPAGGSAGLRLSPPIPASARERRAPRRPAAPGAHALLAEPEPSCGSTEAPIMTRSPGRVRRTNRQERAVGGLARSITGRARRADCWPLATVTSAIGGPGCQWTEAQAHPWPRWRHTRPDSPGRFDPGWRVFRHRLRWPASATARPRSLPRHHGGGSTRSEMGSPAPGKPAPCAGWACRAATSCPGASAAASSTR